MKATRIFSLFVCIIILYGITNAGEKKLVNVDVPLPDDTKIIAPAEGVPKKIAAFSGAWEGRWAYYGADAALIVESINSKNAKVIYCRGKSDHYSMPASCERYNAIVASENPQIVINLGNKKLFFNMEANLNQLKGILEGPLASIDIMMTKIKH